MKPTLVIMAAGMGSRYGGLKQIDPVDEQGHIIMDFSIYDAVKAGFGKVVFVIKEENRALFQECVGDRVAKRIPVEYVYQKLENIPEGFAVPEGRVKPWGTGHAVLCAAKAVSGPFAVINADDYYGSEAFALISNYLTSETDGEKKNYTMVGYRLKNTLTDNGSVARGVCQTDENHHLTEIVERTRIEKKGDGAAYTEDDGNTWVSLPMDTIVSMNMWGFTYSMMDALQERFAAFLEKGLQENPMKCEYFLPFVVDDMIQENLAEVTVLKSEDKWYGVTYKEDKATVVAAIQSLKDKGLYPAEF